MKPRFSTGTCSDGAFYLRGEMGELALAKPEGSELMILSTVEIPRGKETTSTFPIVAGGRLYLAKDDVLDADSYARSIGMDRIERFLAIKRAYDPEGLFQSALFRRIFAQDSGERHVSSSKKNISG